MTRTGRYIKHRHSYGRVVHTAPPGERVQARYGYRYGGTPGCPVVKVTLGLR